MLKILEENAKKSNLNNINIVNKSWYDSWSDIPKTDLVIASRSMEVVDMKEALQKLDKQAKKESLYFNIKLAVSFLSDEILEVLEKRYN